MLPPHPGRASARTRRRRRPGHRDRPRARPPRARSSRARRRLRPECRADRPGTASGTRSRSRRRRHAGREGGSGSASTTSATWWAIASSAARTRCAFVVPRVIPAIRPRASASHQGEPRPVSAGTKTTPSVESTLCASASLSAALGEHAEAVTQPLQRGAADEHRAFERVAVRGRRLQQSGRRRRRVVAGVHEHEAARPVGRLPLARRVTPLAEERRLLVAGDPANLPHAPRAAPPSPDRARPSRRFAAAAPGRRRRAPAARRPSRASAATRASCATRSSRRSRAAARSVSCQTSQVSTVPNASPARPCSRRSHSSFVAEKYGSGTSPVRSRIRSVSSSRQRSAGAPVLPDDRRRDRASGHAVPEHRRLALVRDRDRVDAVEPGFRGGGEHALPDLFGIVLDPAGPRKVLRQLARSRGRCTWSSVVDHEAGRAGRALVDREDHDRCAMNASVRRQASSDASA